MNVQNWANNLRAALNSRDGNRVWSILEGEATTNTRNATRAGYFENEFHRLLFYAIDQGSPMDVIEAFLTSRYFRPDYQYYNGTTALLEAISHKRLDVILKLLELPNLIIRDHERNALGKYMESCRNAGLNITRVQGTSAVVYTSVIENIMTPSGACIDLSSTEEFPDSMLAGMACTAYCEMIALHPGGLNDRQLPGAMSALVINGNIFLASSIKSNREGFRALLPGSNTADILGMVQDGGVPHRTGGNCGECAALHLYYSTHTLANHTQLPPGTRVVTIGRTHNGRLVVFPPCHDDSIWGCRLLTTEMAIRGIDESLMFGFDEIVKECGWALTTYPAPFLLDE